MTTHVVYEGESVYSKLEENPNIQIGDTIVYSANNQMGNATYEVVCKEKGLKLISNYDSEMYPIIDSDNESIKSTSNSMSRKKRRRSSSRSSSRSRGGKINKRNKRKTQRKYKK